VTISNHAKKRACLVRCHTTTTGWRRTSSIVRRAFLSSWGGVVGRTELLQRVAQIYRHIREGNSNGLRVTSQTGVAVAVCRGVPMHVYLRLRAGCLDETLSEMDDAKRIYKAMEGGTRCKLAHTSLVLVDEVSIVSSRILTTL